MGHTGESQGTAGSAPPGEPALTFVSAGSLQAGSSVALQAGSLGPGGTSRRGGWLLLGGDWHEGCRQVDAQGLAAPHSCCWVVWGERATV